MKPIVFVLLSSYNGEKYIRQQIESILAQEGCEIRLIVRDDGSTDDTLKILAEYKNEGKLEYYQGSNLGPAKSFLTLMINAGEAEYYAFSDQDDIWENDKIIEGIRKLPKTQNPALYCSNLRMVDNQGNVLAPLFLPEKIATDFYSLVLQSGYLFGCTMIFNRPMQQFVASRGLPQYLVMHDVWLGIIAAMYGNLVYDANTYINYRRHEGNFTGNKSGKNKGIREKLAEATSENKFSFSKQLFSFLEYVSENQRKLLSQHKIVHIISTYKVNWINKIKLLLLLLFKIKYPFKRKIFFCIQVLYNQY